MNHCSRKKKKKKKSEEEMALALFRSSVLHNFDAGITMLMEVTSIQKLLKVD
jgi:hypothetical protein